jgi:MYXO-CTERM domain-containing protein
MKDRAFPVLRILGVAAAALLSDPGVARADTVRPPPARCVPGAEGTSSHNGPYCWPTRCGPEGTCAGGLECREQSLCIRTEILPSMRLKQVGDPTEVTRLSTDAVCNPDGTCPGGGTCVKAPRCVPPGAVTVSAAGAYTGPDDGHPDGGPPPAVLAPPPPPVPPAPSVAAPSPKSCACGLGGATPAGAPAGWGALAVLAVVLRRRGRPPSPKDQ